MMRCGLRLILGIAVCIAVFGLACGQSGQIPPSGAESGCSRIGSADSYGYSRTYGHADTYTRHTRDSGDRDNGDSDVAAYRDSDSGGHSYSHTHGYAYTDSKLQRLRPPPHQTYARRWWQR